MLAHRATEVHAIGHTASLAEAGTAFFEHGVGSLVVVDEAGQPLGMVTDRDVLRRAIAVEGAKLDELTVADVMTSPLLTVQVGDDLDTVLGVLDRNGLRRVPVEENGRIVGIVSFDDLIERLTRVSADVADSVQRQLRSARMVGNVQHVRDEIEQGLSDLHDRLAYAKWSARETFLKEIDAFRDRVRAMLHGS